MIDDPFDAGRFLQGHSHCDYHAEPGNVFRNGFSGEDGAGVTGSPFMDKTVKKRRRGFFKWD
jgi:hypothetical protein